MAVELIRENGHWFCVAHFETAISATALNKSCTSEKKAGRLARLFIARYASG